MREARCDVEANMNSGVGLLIFCYKICYALWIGYDGASRVNKCSPGIACFMLPNVYVALLPGKHCQPFSLPRYCQLVLTRSCHCAFIDSSSVLSAYCRISGKTVEVHIDDFGFHQLYCETCVFFCFFFEIDPSYTLFMRDLRFSQPWLWRVLTSGMLLVHHVGIIPQIKLRQNHSTFFTINFSLSVLQFVVIYNLSE